MSQVNTAIASLKKENFNRAGLEDLMKRRFIIAPAFQIYNGPAGLYDYGPVGCAIKANLIALWRQHFVLTEDMLEVDCTSLTPAIVLRASGHEARFNDYMVKDTKTGTCLRADHLLEATIDKILDDPKHDKKKDEEYKLDRAKAGDMTEQELAAAFIKYAIVSPETGNALTPPFLFNLMFGAAIGPAGNCPGYLRPETAQGIFVNFKRLLEYNGGKLPFAAAQIGNAFRNEIAPRAGLLRVREFTMAEIEHFVKPDDKSTPKFQTVANLSVNLLSAEAQGTTGQIVTMTLGQAVSQGLIANETLGYFLGRTQLFLVTAGVHADKLRFRQHQHNEMAHYANDCWDAEIFSSYGWVECVGHADRGCYDLIQHTEYSGQVLQYYEEFKDGPKMEKVMKPTINKGLVGKTFKGQAKDVIKYLETLSFADAKALDEKLKAAGLVDIEIKNDNNNNNSVKFTITKDVVTFTEGEEKISGQNITPHVIEPSFGLGRIIYSLLEHAYNVRPQDQQRCYLSLTPIIAPIKVSVLPLTSSEKLEPFVKVLVQKLKEAGVANKVDSTGHAIGRRYARTDEIGIPFGITVDFTTVEDQTVTLRERDSMKQIRVTIAEVADVVAKLCDGVSTWAQVLAKFPLYESKE